MKVAVRYDSWAALQRDCAQQLAHNGYFLKLDLGLPQFAGVDLELRAPDGETFLLDAEVVQVLPGTACAV